MKSSKWIVVILAALVLAAVAALVLKRQPARTAPPAPAQTASPASAQPAAPAIEPQEAPVPAAEESAPAQPTATPPVAAVPEQSLPKPIEILADDVLAVVNGEAIKGKDMIFIGESFADKPQVLSAEAHEFLLRQAVERKLVSQAAVAESITLTESQRLELDKVRESVLARHSDPASGSLGDNGTVEERTKYEQAATENDMLLTNLMAKRGINPPGDNLTDDQVQSYYKEHESEFEPLPDESAAREEKWKAIDFRIRQQLAHAAFAQYHAEGRRVIEELKSRAEISFTDAE